MNLQYSLSARLDLALIRGEKFCVKVAGKPTKRGGGLVRGIIRAFFLIFNFVDIIDKVFSLSLGS
jgi:hypothetical protein